ncbi:MAG: ArnT family glycosyltransferase, partial [Candidatus Heimdallarchaeota archaeon]
MSKKVEIALLTLICSLFFILASYNINLPGLYYDEALDVVPTMQLATGRHIDQHNSMDILGHKLPIMVSDHVGAVSTYLTLPFFLLLGVSVSSLRLTTIVFAVGTLIFTFCFLKLFFNRVVAFLAALLLAVNPAFIMWSRQGNHVSSLMSFMATGSLYCFYLWYKKRKDNCLYIGSFLLGLGLWQKIIFLWFIAALGLAVLTQGTNLKEMVSFRTWIRETARKVVDFGIKRLVLSLLSFCVGLSMMLWYNLTTLGTIRTILNNLVVTSGGVSNLGFSTNFLKRVEDFRHVLSGDLFSYTGGSYANKLYIPLFTVAFLFYLVVSLLPMKSINKKKIRFILILFITLFIFSCFTIGGLTPHHLLILLPLPQVIISSFIYDAVGLLRGFDPSDRVRRVLTIVPLTVAMAIVILDLGVVKSYHGAMNETGGTGMFSDAIYDLASYLQDNDIATPLAIDWGFRKNIQLLTKGAVNPIEIFQYSWNPNEEFYGEVSRRLSDPNHRYLFHAEEFTSFKRYDAFERVVREAGKAVQLDRAFYQRDGTPVYYVYRVANPGQGYFLWKEGEDYETSFGNKGEDFKGGASNGKCLGMWWGSEASHFVLYNIHVTQDIPEAYIYLRYAHAENRARELNVYFDGELVGTKPSIVLPGSGGWGYEESEWALMGVSLGKVTSGEHWIKIQP